MCQTYDTNDSNEVNFLYVNLRYDKISNVNSLKFNQNIPYSLLHTNLVLILIKAFFFFTSKSWSYFIDSLCFELDQLLFVFYPATLRENKRERNCVSSFFFYNRINKFSFDFLSESLISTYHVILYTRNLYYKGKLKILCY